MYEVEGTKQMIPYSSSVVDGNLPKLDEKVGRGDCKNESTMIGGETTGINVDDDKKYSNLMPMFIWHAKVHQGDLIISPNDIFFLSNCFARLSSRYQSARRTRQKWQST